MLPSRATRTSSKEALLFAGDIRKIRIPGSVTLSPDGKAVAFTVTEIVGEAYHSAIFIAPSDGSAAPARLTDGPRDTVPSWSPDGRALAFLRPASSGTHQLCVMPASGGAIRTLTSLPLGVGSAVTARHARGMSAPVWSPDSRRIAFTARIPANSGFKDGSAARFRRITRLRYRIDELGYTHDRPSQVFVIDATGGSPTQLSEGEYDHWDVSWHPGGEHVVAATARHPTRDLDEANDVVALGVDGTLRCLTHSTTTVNLPTCGPDGSTLYYVGIDVLTDANDARGRNLGLWAVPYENGGTPARITDTETIDLDDGRTRPLLVSDDGILGGLLDRGTVRLMSYGYDGVTREVIGGHRQVTDYTMAGGTVAACVTDARSAGEIIAVRGGTERVITTFGAALADTDLRTMSEITATAADGYPVHGWLMLPSGSGPHPVLLLIHGGPDMQVGYQLHDEAQVCAAAGYAVVLSNPRGSAGYGEAHARAIKGRIGSVDADDLVALLKAVTARRDLDPDRVGVLGGSYGGLMTAWLAAHHGHLFRAALSERGVYAWDSMVGTSDVALAAMSMVGADPEAWPSQSPLTYADRISIPLLIMHWEGDRRVPFEQAQRLFAALRARHWPVELVVFPDGNHNTSRNGLPSDRIARLGVVLDWFNRFLRQTAEAPSRRVNT